MEEIHFFDKNCNESTKNEIDSINLEFLNWKLKNLATKIRYEKKIQKTKFNIL